MPVSPQTQDADPIVPLTPVDDWEIDAGNDGLPGASSVGETGDQAGTRGKPASPAPAPAQPKHPTKVMRMAQDLGIPRAEIEAANTDDLYDRISSIQAYLLGQAEARVNQAQVQDAVSRTVAGTQQNPSDQLLLNRSVDAGQSGSKVDPDFGFDPEGYDPAIIAYLRKLHGELKDVRGQLATVNQRETQRQAVDFEGRADAAFAALDASHRKFLGTAGAADMDRQGREFQARVRLLKSIGNLEQLAALPAKTFAAEVKKAAEAIYGPAEPAVDTGAYGGAAAGSERTEAVPEPTPAPSSRDVPPRGPNGQFLPADRWRDGALRRPTNRAGATELKGYQTAIKNVASLLKEQGVLGDSGEANKDDFE